MVEILVPISVCVILPVSIVLIIYLASMNSDNKRAEILIKAIEANKTIDADKLAASFQKSRKTEREVLSLRLLRGCIFSFVGMVFIIQGLVTKIAGGWIFTSAYVGIPLIIGATSLAIGLSYLTVYFMTRKRIIGSEDEK